jgi:hypothetical protein
LAIRGPIIVVIHIRVATTTHTGVLTLVGVLRAKVLAIIGHITIGIYIRHKTPAHTNLDLERVLLASIKTISSTIVVRISVGNAAAADASDRLRGVVDTFVITISHTI